MHIRTWFRYAALIAATVFALTAAEHRGVVKFGNIPVPGATVTAKQGEKTVTALTDGQGAYTIADVADGPVSVKVEMRGFTPVEKEVPVGEPAEWSISMLALTEITSAPSAEVRIAEAPKVEVKRPANVAAPAATNTTSAFQKANVTTTNAPPPPATEATAEVSQRAADGFLVNGSVNNAASSPFSQLPAFGNNRTPGRWPYNGNVVFQGDNSTFDARPFSLTGQNTDRPAYNKLTGIATIGGPIRIPGLLRNGPQFTLTYQWTRNRNVTTQSTLMPTALERAGDFSQSLTPRGTPVQVIDPSTGLPLAGNRLPVSSISPQAQALLQFYPLPNFNGQARYNFQVPLINNTHLDQIQFRSNRQLGRKDNIQGTLVTTSTRTDNPNLFGFLATGRQRNTALTFGWRHNFSSRFYVNFGYQFNRNKSRNVPFFSNRTNVSALAGITGNNQEPNNWGPPSLSFANGISPLGEQQYSSTANTSHGLSVDSFRAVSRHNITYGFDYRRTQLNSISQDNPRGAFNFTGASTGSDFAGFLYGIPDTASVAFGNADKYYRSNAWDGYVQDDYRFKTGLTLNLQARWEYNTPITERYGRLVNLGIGGNFATATPIVAGTFIKPDKNNFAPRFGFAWRPFAASSVVVRGGYGIYFDNSVYQNIAGQMAQQAPLSTSLRVQNTAANPLTLANGFRGTPTISATTFAVDPNFRVGYAQTWNLIVQRDLPMALQMVVTYAGTKGTRGVQQFLPNTFPTGAINPCAACPSGFSYMTSNGNSIRNAGTLQLRRRLRRGFTAELTYTYAKAIDNAALAGVGNLTAQNWLDLRSERSRSNFDQRHVVGFTTQYTTGATSGMGFLTTGRTGAFFREWTFASQINYATGLPLTPTFPRPVSGTGATGSIRANYTGLDPYDAPPGLFLNPLAYTAPAAGQWGNAGRNTITGPNQLTMNASAGRTFRWGDRMNADLRVDASNALNHPVFPSWNAVISSAQFGLPNPAGTMRTVQTSLRMRF
ncbi:MAG: TonB-dependent receptor [Bryobacteraceae bacterium]